MRTRAEIEADLKRAQTNENESLCIPFALIDDIPDLLARVEELEHSLAAYQEFNKVARTWRDSAGIRCALGIPDLSSVSDCIKAIVSLHRELVNTGNAAEEEQP